MQHGLFQSYMKDILWQAFFILLISIAIGLAVNQIRSDSIPLITDWSAEKRLISDSGESLAITISLAKDLFEKNEAIFLDARDKSQFESGHIKGAKNLPWHAVEQYFIEMVPHLPNDAHIITYCDGESCALSHELALFLNEMGFDNVKILVNGWTVWQQMNLPVESGSNEE